MHPDPPRIELTNPAKKMILIIHVSTVRSPVEASKRKSKAASLQAIL